MIFFRGDRKAKPPIQNPIDLLAVMCGNLVGLS
jgi:hypothetical protein